MNASPRPDGAGSPSCPAPTRRVFQTSARRQRLPPPELAAAADAWATVLAALCQVNPRDVEEHLLAEAERHRLLYLKAKSLASTGAP